MDQESRDSAFFEIATQCGSIENVLDAFFGFLERKTDFFCSNYFTGRTEEGAVAGELLVLRCYRRRLRSAARALQTEELRHREADEERRRRSAAKAQEDRGAFAAREAELQRPAVPEQVQVQVAACGPKTLEEATTGDSVVWAPGEKPPVGHGGSTDRYTWTQTRHVVEIFLPLRPGTAAKQVVCEIRHDSLRVGLKGEAPLLEGQLPIPVKADESVWTLVDGKQLHITLEKSNDRWWSCILLGEPEINVKKIVNEDTTFGDLDPSSRSTVDKLLHDNRMRQMGKLDEEPQMHSLLQQALQKNPELKLS